MCTYTIPTQNKLQSVLSRLMSNIIQFVDI